MLVLVVLVGELAHEDDPRVDGAADRYHQDVQARSDAGRAEDNDARAKAAAGHWNVDQQGESVESGEEGKSSGV